MGLTISKTVDIEVDVDVDVSIQEIIQHLAEFGRAEDKRQAYEILNRLNNMARNIPVDWFTPEQREVAVKAFQAIDGAGLARVDFFLERASGKLLVNEINTLPGLTDVSGFPKMWAASGVLFPDVLERLIQLALERHRDRSRNETER